MLARIQAEQAEVDLDVAVGALQAAQREDSLPRATRLRSRIVMSSSPASFSAIYALMLALTSDGPFRVNVETAVRQLPRQDRPHRFVDQPARGRIPNAVLGRMPPQFQQDEIGFERGIGGELAAPVSFTGLCG